MLRAPVHWLLALVLGGPLLTSAPGWPSSPARLAPSHPHVQGRQQQTEPQSTQQPPAQQQRPPAFEATVQRVRVDVIVTDEEGRFVADLTADDFIVLEDGEPRPVLRVQLIDLVQGRIVELKTETESGATDPAAARGTPPGIDVPPPVSGAGARAGQPARGAPRAGGAPSATDPDDPAETTEAGTASELPDAELHDYGAVYFLVDSGGLDWRMKARFAGYWGRWLERADPPTVPWAVYLLDEERRLRELAPLTRDLTQLRSAAERLEDPSMLREALFTRRSADYASRIRELPEDEEYFRRLLEETPANVANFEPLSRFAEGLAGRPGRAALVWVTSLRGFVSPILTQAANTANVSIYVLDPGTGVLARNPTRLSRSMTHPMFDAADQSMPGCTIEMDCSTLGMWLSGALLAMLEQRALLREVRERLRAAPEATGGQLFANWFSLDGPLAAIQDETSRYYLLTYEPPEPHGDGRYHEIGVEVARPGLTVRARGGYLDHGGDPTSLLAPAFRQLGGGTAYLPLVVEAALTFTEDGSQRLMVLAGLDGSTLTRPPDGGASVHMRGELFDDLGQSVGQLSDVFEADETAPGGLLRRRYVLQTEPGRYELRFLAAEPASERLGVARHELEIPEHQPASWQASDPVLVVPSAAGELMPIPAGQAVEGEELAVLVQVLGGGAPVFSGRVVDPLADAAAASERLELPAIWLTQRGRLHEGALLLPVDLVPGEYVLELELADEPAGETRSFTLPVRLLPRR
jgi:VWFA-related protein